MGAWGPAIFADDVASDVRDNFQFFLADAQSVGRATDEIAESYGAINSQVTQPSGSAEPEATLAMVEQIAGWRRVTLGADKGYDRKEFVRELREHLPRHGYPMYEISNYAARGHEARHNLTYWRADTYLGFGAGAHSFARISAGGRRWWNERFPDRYIALALGSESPRRDASGSMRAPRWANSCS